jgi:uncharacterized membrane protein YccC
MDDERKVYAAGERAVAGVVLCIGLGAFAVLAFAARNLMALERALDPGDIVVLGVFAMFGVFCIGMGWRLLGKRGEGYGAPQALPPSSRPSQDVPTARVRLSQGCAAAGVVLLILTVLVPPHWYPVVLLFLGLACLAVSHALAPCVERMEQLRKARGWERQL